MEQRRVVKSYNHIWKINRTFYNIGGMNLPIPVSFNLVIYFIITELIMFTIGGFIPWGSIRYLIIPLAAAWFLDQKLLDGKNPFKFAKSVIIYYFIIFTKGKYVSRYRYYKIEKPQIKANIPFRVHYRDNTQSLD